MPSKNVATLLFSHGAGFCKESWEPVMRRVQASLAQQRTPCDLVTFDFSYHGAKHDKTATPRMQLAEGAKVPLVSLGDNAWQQWNETTAFQQAHLAREQYKQPVIGIGHSMGGAALWAAEALNPGTFDGLVLFEPIYQSLPGGAKARDFLVAITLAREQKWASRADAQKYFHELKNFASWTREALDSYIKGALVDEADGSVSLACQPQVEASMYCAQTLQLTDEQLVQPKCQIAVHSAEHTRLFNRHLFEDYARRFPELYRLTPPMAKRSHMMIFEDPEASANQILEDLARLPLFQTVEEPLTQEEAA